MISIEKNSDKEKKMSQIKKNSVLKAVVFCFSLIIINNYCFPWVYMNGSSGGYNENSQPPGIQGNIPMEMLLIDGAGYFMKTQSNVQILLNMVEWQDIKFIDYFELNQLVKRALTNIVNARLAYGELIKIAEATPYNLDVIKQLNRFDYDAFLTKHGLNPFIFGVVRDYLINGDIAGTFKHAYGNFKEIEKLLLNIQSSILENRLPELEVCWKLNERCAGSSLFGSYIARIFMSIK